LKLLHGFTGFLVHIGISLCFYVFILADACWTAYKRDPKHREPTRGATRYVAAAALAASISFALGTYLYLDKILGVQAFRVPSSSMAPTIVPGDHLIVNLLAYHKEPPRRGELVVLESRAAGGLIIKRVEAVGGDLVPRIEDEIVALGEMTTERSLGVEEGASGELGPPTIPPDRFFVVGDNRKNSFDSRYPDFGLVQRTQIKGKPIYIYWSRSATRIGRLLE
jgi:signal peptidase I